MDDAEADAVPLAYGLLETRTLKLLLTNVYAREDVARQAAERKTNQWKTFVVIPLFGPDTYALLAKQLETSRTQVASLRADNVLLRNQLAQQRGVDMARRHGHRVIDA